MEPHPSPFRSIAVAAFGVGLPTARPKFLECECGNREVMLVAGSRVSAATLVHGARAWCTLGAWL